MSHSTNNTHLLLYSYPGSGHTIPLLDLTHLLLCRGLTVTIIVTSTADIPLLDPFLSLYPSSLHKLVFPDPEVTPSRHPLIAKVNSTQKLFDPIVQWFRSHPSPPTIIVSDFLLGWTSELASHLGIRRVVFSPSGAFSSSVIHTLWQTIEQAIAKNDVGDENFLLAFQEIPNSPEFPWWQVPQVMRDYETGDQEFESFRKGMLANMTSWGILYNTFEKLEEVYVNHMKSIMGHDRVWAVGPLLPETNGPIAITGRGGWSTVSPDHLFTWLDQKPNESVVYICFGSQVELNEKQMSALARALELSKVNFILCVKGSESSTIWTIPSGFEDRVGNRGLIVMGWVPQLAMLRHRAFGSFVTHCGWNSTLEAIIGGVVMLTWPMIADQFANAALLVDQLGIAKRACDGGPESVPDSVELARLLDESLSVESPERVKIKELNQEATNAVEQGTSTRDLDTFVKLVSEI
ncbi:putative UDP-glucuronosyl/UDP-glucosyltransferase [Helianthus annuus]|nr:putative UDP-glucuronosyl/UDP-glucosyltransferase [Helianthus annuus]